MPRIVGSWPEPSIKCYDQKPRNLKDYIMVEIVNLKKTKNFKVSRKGQVYKNIYPETSMKCYNNPKTPKPQYLKINKKICFEFICFIIFFITFLSCLEILLMFVFFYFLAWWNLFTNQCKQERFFSKN